MGNEIVIQFPEKVELGDGRLLPRRPRLAHGGSIRNGKFLIMADHSVFINDMMLRQDTDNFDFAYNCINWLTKTESGRRTKVLFYEEGKVVTDFNVTFKAPRFPSQQQLVDLANRKMSEAEDRNIFNRMAARAFSSNPSVARRRYLSAIVIVLTVLLVMYGLIRLVRARFRWDRAAPLLDHALVGSVPTGSTMQLRYQALSQQNDYRDPAQLAARNGFATVAGFRLDRPPRVETDGSWRQRRQWHKRIQTLWQVATSKSRRTISRRGLVNLVAEINLLRTALADGSVRLSW